MSSNGTPSQWADSPAAQHLQSRLSEERTLQALDKILDRLDTVEQAIGNLTTMMHQGPGMTAMVADIVDETYRKADANGVSIDQRLNNALEIAEKLTAPEMVDKLNQLFDFSNQAPGLIAMTADMADEVYRQADANGVSIEQRLKAGLDIAEKLTAPEMVAKLDQLLQLTDQLPGLVAMTADMADEAYRNADANGINIEQRLKAGLDIAEKLTAPEMVAQLNQLIDMSNQFPGLIAMAFDTFDEGMKNAFANGFDPKNLSHIAGLSNRALTLAQNEPPAKVNGVFGLLGALKDKDRQRGLGFLLNFLKHFGKAIE